MCGMRCGNYESRRAFPSRPYLTIAIGIGANTAIFSSMDAVVLRPLAVPAMDHVVTIAERQDRGTDQNIALANYQDWKHQSRSFEEMAVRTSLDMSLTGAGDAAHVSAALTSASFFSLLRIQPVLGRLFVQNECQPGRDAVALLNYGFWQRQFAGDPTVLGGAFASTCATTRSSAFCQRASNIRQKQTFFFPSHPRLNSSPIALRTTTSCWAGYATASQYVRRRRNWT